MSNKLTPQVQAKIDEIKAVADQLPGVVILNDLVDGSVLYMSERGVKELGCSLEELQALGPEYHNRFFNPKEAEEYVPKVLAMVDSRDPDEVVTFFQQVRRNENDEWKWYLSSIKKLLSDENGTPIVALTITHHIDPVSHLTGKVQRLLDENTFLRNNYTRFSALGTREKEVLALLAVGNSSIEIARDIGISVSTVDTHRRNIKRKLKAGSSFELAQYARAFDLI
jgi:DNA-binding CsgD family transcriptional regulator